MGGSRIQLRFARLLSLVALAISAALGCSTQPVPRDVTGTWSGSMDAPSVPWTLTMTLTQVGDSITGQSTASHPPTFREEYTVSGKLVGDSVLLRLFPVEDATVFIHGRLAADRIHGAAWLNYETMPHFAVTLARE